MIRLRNSDLENQMLAKKKTRSNSRTSLLIAFVGFTFVARDQVCAQELSIPMAGHGQLAAPLEWIEDPANTSQSWMAQASQDGRLLLTANEAFFPKLGLVAGGQGRVPDTNGLNKGRSFERIERWDPGDVAEWGLLLQKAGDLKVRVVMSSKGRDGQFKLQLGQSIVEVQPDVSAKPTVSSEGVLKVTRLGKHSLNLICNQASPETSLHWIELSGAAAEGASILRKRWRPAAAHTKFSSSESPQRVRLWVMEMDAVAGTLDFYSPITTPFGYYGPTWRADGTVNSQFNFSLWSYGRGKEAPPIEQQSHLLAIGNPNATFGEFGHEGTGVKVRDWHPLAGRQGQRQAFALRVEPGTPYDTYYSYFYASDQKRWRLFAVGNKYSKRKPIDSLTVGSFVEVPGPSQVQRTGPYPRVMRYRGWVMDEQGDWFALDQMTNGNVDRETGLTHTRRGVTPDGWFYLQTGGWEFRKAASDRFTTLPAKSLKRGIGYLQEHMKASLMIVPSEISVSSTVVRQSRLEVTYKTKNLGHNASVTLYWGTEEALTFADRWQHQRVLELADDISTNSAESSAENSARNSPGGRDHKFTINRVPPGKTIYFRLKLRNHEGQFWTRQTSIVQPLSK